MHNSQSLPLNHFGATDIQVSALGLGTVKFGRNQGVKYPSGFSLPSDKEIADILAVAQQGGINLLDTAPAYGTSEERLGKILSGSRQDWIICSKAGEEFIDGISTYYFTPEKINASVERSLKRLKTDYLDIVLIHSDGRDVEIIQQGALDALDDLKKQGKILATGMSTKTVEGGILAAKHSDCVMVTYNLQDSREKSVIDYCFENNKGVLLKKIFASGHIQSNQANHQVKSPQQQTMDFIFKQKGISSAIVGSINPRHILENINAACNSLKN
ncbi:aldo/keto reductase [Aurantivibrio infirmus]